MLTLDKRIKKWSRKVNRNKSFTPIEMVEMEDHLLVEIKQMVQYVGMTEEEAFQKALKTLGEQGILDEEFGKIRRSAFDKVKLWAYLQTFVILALVVFILVPYIHFPIKENPNTTGFITGGKFGEISSWFYEPSKDSADSYVTFKNETYFYISSENNIYYYRFGQKYGPHILTPKSITSVSSYFDSVDSCTCIKPFDIDSQKNLYILNSREDKISVYRNSIKVKEIRIPAKYSKDLQENIKVIGNNLIMVATKLICPQSLVQL